MTSKAIAYYRVSTQKQGRTGYGLDAQRTDVKRLVAERNLELTEEFTEVESGRHNNRPILTEALERCRLTGATLIVAKLDRLGRNQAFVCALRDAGIDFTCCDMPEANRLMLGIMAAMAEHESDAIRERTKAAIVAAKARGVKWGQSGKNHTPEHMDAMRSKAARIRVRSALMARLALVPAVMDALKANNQHAQLAADHLNANGVKTTGGKGKWYPHTVKRIMGSI